MRPRSAPNDLRCGCRLGPTIRLCGTAQQLTEAKRERYRRTISNPYDLRAGRRYLESCDRLDEHWTRNGAYENGPAGADRRGRQEGLASSAEARGRPEPTSAASPHQPGRAE